MKINSVRVRSECEREGDQHEPGGPREVLHDSLAAEVVEEDVPAALLGAAREHVQRACAQINQ